MAPSIISNNAVQDEVFLPGQIFVFGGFVLRANSVGRLEQIDSYAPGHQVRFGNLNYTADIRGDLIFDGFEPTSGAPNSHDGHDFDLPSDSVRDIAPAAAPASDLGQITLSVSGGIDPAMEAALLVAMESDTDFTTGFVSGHGLRAACVHAYRIRLGADHGVHLRRYLSALAPWVTC